MQEQTKKPREIIVISIVEKPTGNKMLNSPDIQS